MKKNIVQPEVKNKDILSNIGYLVMDWKWYQWALWYIACFCFGFGIVGMVAIVKKNKG